MTVEFWRWREYSWVSPSLDWRKGRTVSAGVDVGSVSSQAVIMVDGQLYAYASMRTGSDSPNSARNAMAWALKDAAGLKLEDMISRLPTLGKPKETDGTVTAHPPAHRSAAPSAAPPPPASA